MTKNISVTLDVEDLRPSDQFEDRSKLMTEKVLDLFSEMNIRATIFVVGDVAKNHPEIINKAVKDGHEIGLHSHKHIPLQLLTPDEFEQVSKMKGMVTSTQPALTAFGLKYNCKAEYTSDINVRKAIAYAYDYDAFVKIFNGRAKLQTSPFSDDIKGKIDVPGMPRKDMAKAKAFLAKSKWPNGGFEIEYVYVQGFEVERQMGLVLIDALRPLNITVKMVPLTWSNMVARGSKVETSPQLMAIFATPVSTDPDAVAIQYHPSSLHNFQYAVPS